MKIIKELQVKILLKEGPDTELINLSTVAKVVGYANSTPVLLKSYEVGIEPVRVGKRYKIKKSELERLLTALIVMGN